MSRLLLWVILTLGSVDTSVPLNDPANICRPRNSCSECITSQPQCAWCKQKNFTKEGEPDSTRCDSESSLRQRGCQEGEVINPQSTHVVTESRDLGEGAGGEAVVQLAPQKISLKLRPGLEEKFTVTFRRAEGYPVDLYYLTDLSYSMKDDLENIKRLGHDLLIALKSVTQSVRIGFGSFVDKTVLPFISTSPQKYRNPCPDRTEQCQPPFSFRNVLPLTHDAGLFEERVRQQRISGNLDPPEGGLDAVMQAAVCGSEVGWRKVTRLLVYTSDAEFHTAGDGKLGGVFLPNDGRCHLDTDGLYAESQRYDYPSVGQLAQTLSQQNIQPIFAVTENSLKTYQALSKLIPKSVVGELKEDSSNVVQLITEAYNNLSSTINLEHSTLPDGLSVRFESHCGIQNTAQRGRGECSNVRINEEISFTVTVSADASSCSWQQDRFELRILGLAARLEVRVDTVCGCLCGDGGSEDDQRYCSHGNGTFRCGQCSCRPGHLGKFCECWQGEAGVLDLSKLCRPENGPALCGGRGQCVCGQCVCEGQLRGRFCECDDNGCVRHNNRLCGGNGKCSCGQCQCSPGYTGEGCECSTLQTDCFVPGAPFCNGHGKCKCNRCECEAGYQGATCHTCVTCPSDCDIYKPCAQCSIFHAEGCDTSCSNVTVLVVKKLLDGQQRCTEKDSEGDLIEFVVQRINSEIILHIRERAPASDRTSIVIISVMVGIVLIGLGSLVMWRLMVELYDRREFHRFEKERRNERWNEAGNPLFKSATTTVVNPQFMEE